VSTPIDRPDIAALLGRLHPFGPSSPRPDLELVQRELVALARALPGARPDWWIRAAAAAGMIEPFEPGQVRAHPDGTPAISWGTSSYGYDARAAPEWRVFSPVSCAVVDPKAFAAGSCVESEGPSVLVPPNSYALCRTVERFRIPRDCLAICVGKSTYARCGILVNVTPLEPGWEGHVTVEIGNGTPLPARVYAEGIMQIVFVGAAAECEVAYGERPGGGKYQGQGAEVVPARV
jgi:dCTP deaminase